MTIGQERPLKVNSGLDELASELRALDYGPVEFLPRNDAISVLVKLFESLFESLFVELGVSVYELHGMDGEPSEF